MTRTVAVRLVTLVPLVWLVVTLTFVVVQAAPGDYADAIGNPRLSPAARDLIRARYGLDETPLVQYGKWVGAVVTGDLGVSFLYKEPVTRVLSRALPPTLLLAGCALFIDFVIGIALAAAAARRPHGWADRMTTLLALGIYGLPSFWLAGIVVLVFSLTLGWFPPSHMHDVRSTALTGAASFLDLVRHLVLPASCLGLVGAAATARYLRSTLIDVHASRWMLAARARGVSRRRLFWVHALRPSLLPLITIFGLSVPVLVSGSVVIETVFSWPGMGQILYHAASARDIPLILGATLVGTAFVVAGNLVADLLYLAADPRTRSVQ